MKNALRSTLTLPSTVEWREEGGDLIGRWTKTGGYAGEKVLARVRERALELGYMATSSNSSGTPDGSHVGSGTVLEATDGSVQLTFDRSYGVTKDKNRFSLTVKYRTPVVH